jgi:hypothetical protein
MTKAHLFLLLLFSFFVVVYMLVTVIQDHCHFKICGVLQLTHLGQALPLYTHLL